MAELQLKDIKDSSFPFRISAEPSARAPNQKQRVFIEQANKLLLFWRTEAFLGSP